MTPHICTCGDCEVAPFDDRCKYEAALPTDPWFPVVYGDAYSTTECYACHADWDFGARQHKSDCKWLAAQPDAP